MLKSLWKRCWKMMFSHFFYHKFLSIKYIWVDFILLESRHPGLQFEHKYYLIWIYFEWIMTVWSWVIRVVKIRVSGDACVRGEHSCVHGEHACVHSAKPSYAGQVLEAQKFIFFRAQSLSFWWVQPLDPLEHPKPFKWARKS